MIIIIILSFILEGVFSNLVSLNSILLPLFTITSLVICYPYFNKIKKYHFIITSIIIGIIYDIAYTNSLFINTFTFTLCSLIIIYLDNYIHDSLINKTIINIILLIFFKVMSYLLLFIFGFIKFNYNILLKGVYSSIIKCILLDVKYIAQPLRFS